MRRTLLILALLEGLVGCAPHRARTPAPRGGVITVVNDTDQPVTVVASSPIDHLSTIAHTIWPMSRLTFSWPFVANDGELHGRSELRRATFTAHLFRPLESDAWCWHVSAPTVVRGHC